MNSYGSRFRLTLFGESHQQQIGFVLEGVPPGTVIDEELIRTDLSKRRPGKVGTTPRVEADRFEITAGVFNGRATGSPIHLVINNTDTRSKDYEHLRRQPRPGHADFVAQAKYKGYQDYRGGGRFSGRLTAALVAAGSIAKMVVPYRFEHELVRIGTLTDLSKIDQYLESIAETGDSVGGIIEVRATGVPVGLGEPFFQKLDGEIGRMFFSIPAVKGVEIGTGFAGIEMMGSQFNDAFIDEKGTTATNHSGGISGGISNGNDVVARAFIKPTSSIGKNQKTYDLDRKETKDLAIGGRHDVAICRRAGIVLENALAIVLADLTLLNG
ncbi:MAG: chorismate synthase [Acholeplasmataceae bacterium]